MADNKNTGAADWRSELEKRKSLLRKSTIALFKTWIPDHPEASTARGEVFSLFQTAMNQYANAITLVNQLSFGSEDITAHEFANQPISLQELLVQREGTDAFLDPKNALRVVRRKFGMMTLISRMASSMEQRNIASIRIGSGISQEDLIKVCRLMSRRVEGTSAEEEEELRRQLRRLDCKEIDVLFHVEVVGRKVPVPWVVKEIYSRLAIQNEREGALSGDKLVQFSGTHAVKLNAKSIRQLSLYNREMKRDLGDSAFDPFPDLIRAANQRIALTATRNIFDEFNELRARRKQRAALEQSGEHVLTEEEDTGLLEDEDTDFSAEATDVGGDDEAELLRLGDALNRIRDILGRSFFAKISMVSGDINFVDSATGTDGADAEIGEETLSNPVEALRRARAVSEPLYRCRSLSTVTPTLVSAGRLDDALAAASEALDAARVVPTEDKVNAFSACVRALIETEQSELAAVAVTECLAVAHNYRDLVERSAALVRVASTLIETGTLPITVKKAVSRAILGPDVHFWGKAAVKSPLVEAVIAIISSREDDSLIFLQKVIVHEDPSVRRSVIRTMPLDDVEQLEKMLLSHLKDQDSGVRVEVIERLGSSGQLKFGVYLVNTLRQDGLATLAEKRSLALNLGRLDPQRYYHVYNAMLGKMGLDDPAMIKRMPKFKDDQDLQVSALEALYHLRSREARRILYHAAHEGRGGNVKRAKALWQVVKSSGYGDPSLPRSPHDPEWSEDDLFDFELIIEEGQSILKDGETDGAGEGIVGFIKGLFSKPSKAPPAMESLAKDADDGSLPPMTPLDDARTESSMDDSFKVAADAQATDEVALEDEEATPEVDIPRTPEVGLRLEAMVQRDTRAWSGRVPMLFTIHESVDSETILFSESVDEVLVTAGRFEVTVGASEALPQLPKKVWMQIEVDGEPLEPRMEITNYRSVIQG